MVMQVRLVAVVLLVVAAAVCAAADQDFHGPAWQNQPNTVKQKVLWSAVNEDHTPNSYPGTIDELGLFVESMNLTFDSAWDNFMPNKLKIWPYTDGRDRQKLIHSVGPVAMVQWVSSGDHNYTGMFKGANYGLIRLSSAAKPSTGSSPSLAPGMGLKFMRTNMPSTNVIAMYSLTGQTSFNFFEHDLTNHVPDLGTSAPFALTLIRGVFRAASDWPTMLGSSDFARFSQEGVEVKSPSFPFRLVFHPAKAYHEKFGSNPPPTDDVLEITAAAMASGTTLYEIYAQPDPVSDNVTRIGYLKLTSDGVMTTFGDKKMFLQHVRMEDDFAYHPEWLPSASYTKNWQLGQEQYFFPDLPFN